MACYQSKPSTSKSGLQEGRVVKIRLDHNLGKTLQRNINIMMQTGQQIVKAGSAYQLCESKIESLFLVLGGCKAGIYLWRDKEEMFR